MVPGYSESRAATPGLPVWRELEGNTGERWKIVMAVCGKTQGQGVEDQDGEEWKVRMAEGGKSSGQATERHSSKWRKVGLPEGGKIIGRGTLCFMKASSSSLLQYRFCFAISPAGRVRTCLQHCQQHWNAGSFQLRRFGYFPEATRGTPYEWQAFNPGFGRCLFEHSPYWVRMGLSPARSCAQLGPQKKGPPRRTAPATRSKQSLGTSVSTESSSLFPAQGCLLCQRSKASRPIRRRGCSKQPQPRWEC